MVSEPKSVASPDQNASAKAAESSVAPARAGWAAVGEGAWLDHRHALVHPQAGWMAVADLHFGYATTRRRQGALLPDWGREPLQNRLNELLHDHRPRTLILVGDIMDSAASATDTLRLLDQLREQVPLVIPLAGNHDRPALRDQAAFQTQHREGPFLFHHGHQQAETTAWLSQQTDLPPAGIIEVIGHHHPAHTLRDGAGLRLKLPCLVQEQTLHGQRWILPAFSPWSAGGRYSSTHLIRTWLCAPNRVWPCH